MIREDDDELPLQRSDSKSYSNSQLSTSINLQQPQPLQHHLQQLSLQPQPLQQSSLQLEQLYDEDSMADRPLEHIDLDFIDFTTQQNTYKPYITKNIISDRLISSEDFNSIEDIAWKIAEDARSNAALTKYHNIQLRHSVMTKIIEKITFYVIRDCIYPYGIVVNTQSYVPNYDSMYRLFGTSTIDEMIIKEYIIFSNTRDRNVDTLYNANDMDIYKATLTQCAEALKPDLETKKDNISDMLDYMFVKLIPIISPLYIKKDLTVVYLLIVNDIYKIYKYLAKCYNIEIPEYNITYSGQLYNKFIDIIDDLVYDQNREYIESPAYTREIIKAENNHRKNADNLHKITLDAHKARAAEVEAASKKIIDETIAKHTAEMAEAKTAIITDPYNISRVNVDMGPLNKIYSNSIINKLWDNMQSAMVMALRSTSKPFKSNIISTAAKTCVDKLEYMEDYNPLNMDSTQLKRIYKNILKYAAMRFVLDKAYYYCSGTYFIPAKDKMAHSFSPKCDIDIGTFNNILNNDVTIPISSNKATSNQYDRIYRCYKEAIDLVKPRIKLAPINSDTVIASCYEIFKLYTTLPNDEKMIIVYLVMRHALCLIEHAYTTKITADPPDTPQPTNKLDLNNSQDSNRINDAATMMIYYSLPEI